MIKSNYEVEILVNGVPVKEYYKNGNHYVEARKGNNFSIKIRNNGYRKILAVPTVDGLSVMTGKKAGFKSGGYIVSGYSSMTIDGWRVSDSEVNKFIFTTTENSYAERKDMGGNVGVIGVAIFREKEHQVIYSYNNLNQNIDWMCRGVGGSSGGGGGGQFGASSLNASSSIYQAQASNNMVSQAVGTGFGETKESQVVTTTFDEESSPDAVFEIFYNSRKELEKMGIEFKPVQYVKPSAFPNEYCKKI